MASNAKFQAGEEYGEARKGPTNFLSDPVAIATDLLKDYAGVRSEASLPEIVGIIKELLAEGQPLDDKKG